MARTIGKVKIKKLKAMTIKELKKSKYRSEYEIEQKVKLKVPTEWFDIWEGGWSIKAGGLKIQTNSIKLFLNTTKKCKMIGNSVPQHYISKRGSTTAEGLTRKEHKATHERNRTKL